MRLWQWILTVIVVVLTVGGGFVFLQIRGLRVEKIDDDLHVLFGLGGNVAVLNTDEGTVIVDTMTLQYQGDRIRQVATELTGKPVVAIINSHYHLDHTHGNPAFDAGTRVIATERTLQHLLHSDAEYFSGEAAAFLPNETFVDDVRLNFGNKTLRLLSLGRGHTDGDLVVLFEQERVIHMGDLFFHQLYPNIDLEAGGSVREWPTTLERAMKLPFDAVIPGHGEVTDIQGMRKFQAFMQQLSEIGAEAATNGVSLTETKKSSSLTADDGFGEIRMLVPVGIDREFVLQRAWEEATGTVEARP
jgi:cyclase